MLHNARALHRSFQYARSNALDVPIKTGNDDPATWHTYLDLAAELRDLADRFDAFAREAGLIPPAVDTPSAIPSRQRGPSP